MKHTIPPALVLTFTLALALVSCNKEKSNNNIQAGSSSRLSVYLTDHQTPVFDSVFIDIQQLEVKMEDSTSNGGWISLNINPGVYNILRFRNGIDTFFAVGSLPGTQIRKLRLTLGDQNSVMKNGQVFPLQIKDNNQQVVANLTAANFDVNAGQVLFWIDFDAGGSIKTDNSGSGNNQSFELKPKIKVFTKKQSGRIEGKVLPAAADAIIMAIRGTDTAMAIPENNGEFKIVGLDAGSYHLFIDAQNGYQDSTINGIIVTKGEDTHLPSVILHQ
jgi:Domain of unknown function (DUF4382)